MFATIVGRTFRLARRSWLRTLMAWIVAAALGTVVVGLLALLAQVLLGGALDAIFEGTFERADSSRLLVFGLPLMLAAMVAWHWTQLAPIRAASGECSLRAALGGAVAGAWRMLALVAALGAIELLALALDPRGVLLVIVLIVLSVPILAATGELALDPGRWGLRLLLTRGVLRVHRNIGAYLAAFVLLALTGLVAGALYLLPIVLLGGMPSAELTDTAALADWIEGAAAGAVLGTLLALVPSIALPTALTVAVYESLTGQVDHSRWEDDAPYRPAAELSPAVQQLVGAPSQSTRRLVLPPRAPEPGRVPGPGVLQVAGVDLPAGRATRNVEAATLELLVDDGSPGTLTHDEQLWVSRDAIPSVDALWKRLAAGFSETGLWPIAIPVDPASHGTVDWFEHATRREPDVLDPEQSLADRLRVRLSESLEGGSPLASTDLLRASHVARGELRQGQGRRTDALGVAFQTIGRARLAIAPARRPADVLHALAWPGAHHAGIPTAELAELVASWEERYAALLVGLGESSIVFAVLRPPATLDDAVELVAEQHALCPDEAGGWDTDLKAAESLVDAAVWRLTWH